MSTGLLLTDRHFKILVVITFNDTNTILVGTAQEPLPENIPLRQIANYQEPNYRLAISRASDLIGR